jgi:carbamate kinase
MKVVIALGGNALLRRGEPLEADVQRRNVKRAARVIADVAMKHRIVVTHGNGPQVGLLALQAQAYEGVTPYPLDLLNAETEGMLGYLIEQELRNCLPGRKVAGLLTQVEVDAEDPAFTHPSKPIGPLYAQVDAERLTAHYGWSVARDGKAYRRVVPSPEPRRIVELPTIRLLLEAGAIVVCAGGGGIPVVMDGYGLKGVEAVIDKDLSSAVLAEEIGADRLLLLTDVDAVYTRWGEASARALRQATPAELRKYRFAPGSMAPKVEAACRFVERTGGWAGIGRLEDAVAIMAGGAGTCVLP